MTKKKIQRIGILGGTFDPVHNGHLLFASGAAEVLKLDQMLFIPCNRNPLKKNGTPAEADHRIAMLKLALFFDDRFRISKIEITRPGVSYTVDTLRELHEAYRGTAKFFFLIGSDIFSELAGWKSVREITRLCQFVAADRGCGKKTRFPVKIINIPVLNISATEIRRRIKQKKSIRYLVPDKVEKYIYKNRLYCV